MMEQPIPTPLPVPRRAGPSLAVSLVVGAVGLVILTIIEGLLGMRFLLHAFGANPNSGFVGFVDDVSWPFAGPVSNVFSNRSWDQGIIEVSTLVAMGFFFVLFAILGMRVTALAPRLNDHQGGAA